MYFSECVKKSIFVSSKIIVIFNENQSNTNKKIK